MTVRTSVRQTQYLEKWERSNITIGIYLIFTSMFWLIAVETRYPLTSISWPFRGLRFTVHWGCVVLVDRWPGTGFRLDRRLKSDYYSGREEKSMSKGKISAQINTQHVVDFSPDIFLAQSYLGKSLIYHVRNFYYIGDAYWVLFVKI